MSYKLCRMKQGLNQKEAAVLLGVDPSYLSKIEHGAVPSTQEILSNMCRLYGCTQRDLKGVR